eukprot:492140_1
MNSPYQFDSSWDFDSAHITTTQTHDNNRLAVYSGQPLPLNNDRSLHKCVPSETVQFIKHHIANDFKCIFDEYLFQQSTENDNNAPKKQSKRMNNLLCLAFNDIAAAFNKHSNINQPQTAILSSRGWNSGIHEWSFKILACDIYRHEVGIVSVSDIQNIKINKHGIRTTNCFQARAVYGSESGSNLSYYASYNADGKSRCYKDLSRISETKWKKGDVITISLDLNKHKVKYYKQGKKVRKTLSLEANNTYYPIIAFSGHFRCKLLSFK